MPTLEGKVALVTGASRGIGKGIALVLGAAGANVYITGRTQKEGDAWLPGTVGATAEEVTAAGGKGIAVACDHADDDQVRKLFDQIKVEQGALDLLVNNATLLNTGSTEQKPFWEKPLGVADLINVGLRSSYIASAMAVPLMLGRGGGLIAGISF